MENQTIKLNDGGRLVDLFIAPGYEAPWTVCGVYEGPSEHWNGRIVTASNYKKLEDACGDFPGIQVHHNFKWIF